jgi:uncharacterized membrane protein YjjP (DUF1212 family)
MSQSNKNIFFEVLKSLIVSILKLLTLLLAYSCKLSGTILLKTGEFLEKLLAK